LQSFVAEYTITTVEDVWADGLRVQASQAKEARAGEDKKDKEEDGEDVPSLCRSLRKRQKLV
jgi:hypothetical protein